jgi:hypothetical protein
MAIVLNPKDPRCKDILLISQQEARELLEYTLCEGLDSIITALCTLDNSARIRMNDLKILFDYHNGNKDLNLALYLNEDQFNVELIYEKPEDHKYAWGTTERGDLLAYRFNGEVVTFYDLQLCDTIELAGIKDIKGSLGVMILKNSNFVTRTSPYMDELRERILKSREISTKYNL